MNGAVAISPRALRAAMSGDAPIAVFDVREPGETERGHVFGSTPLPRARIETSIDELVADRATPIIVVDDDDGRAAHAAATLRSFGYGDVRALDGGIDGWRREGWPLATGSNVPSKLFGEQVHHDDGVPAVDAATFARWIGEGRDVLLCDVRTPGEYRAATIPGSVSAPGFDLLLGHAALCAHETIVVHCAGRTRSIVGTQTLRDLGYTNVFALENGTMGWALADRPLERGADRVLAVDAEVDARTRAASRARADAAGVRRIDAAALAELLAGPRNRAVFDVRSVAEFEAGHVDGARNVPGGQLVQRTDEFIAVRRAPVVLIDRGDVRAETTAAWLKRMGLPDVAVVDGGVDAWRAAGLPIATGRVARRWLGWEAVRVATPRSTPAAFADRIAAGMTVVDVDTSVRFDAGHVPGARWLPRGRLESGIAALVPSQDVGIGVTCRDGTGSTYAAAALATLGYANVCVLDGGTRAWTADARALETSSMPPQDDVPRPPYARGRQAMRDYLAWETALVPPSVDLPPNERASP